MIKSICDKRVENIYKGEYVKKMDHGLQDIIRRKLKYLNHAATMDDLRVPPGNHFEKLTGRPEYSIRVNDKWRITFIWSDGVENVALEDYH